MCAVDRCAVDRCAMDRCAVDACAGVVVLSVWWVDLVMSLLLLLLFISGLITS